MNIVHNTLISELKSTAAWCGWAQLVVVRGGCRPSGERWPAELQSCHGMQYLHTTSNTPPQSGHSSCLPTILNIILKKPHNHNLTTSVLSNGYLSSGSGTDSAANSSTEWLVLGIFSCSSDLAEGLAICPHLSLNFNVQTVSGCCPGPGRWRRWRCVTGGERRHAWLPSPPPAPLETGALQVSQYSREPIQRRCLIAPA